MRTNIFKQIIHAPVDKVWHFLTDKDIAYHWMNRIKIETNYQPGSAIIFTAYGIEGKLAMTWRGIVEVFEPNQQLMINYKGFNNLLRTTYDLQAIDRNTTRIICSQDCTSYDAAESIGQYTRRAMNRLKDMVERD